MQTAETEIVQQNVSLSQYENELPAPVWLIDNKIHEVAFCRELLSEHKVKCINNQFYDVDGYIPDSEIKAEIYEKLKPHITAGLANRVTQLLSALQYEAYSPEIVLDPNEIHLLNGTLNIDGTFTEEKKFCYNRLNVRYNPEAEMSAEFLKFLEELLDEEDIVTLQEWLGYLLMPSTKAQKMLMLVGNGGEGKSRIGVLLKEIFKEGMATGNLQYLETNPFARAVLEKAYLFLDDDMKMEALTQTNMLKTIITNEGPMLIEKKRVQSYPASIFAKLMGFGNGTLNAANDKSDAFFRRQIIISTKPKPIDRVDDPFLVEKFIENKEGIFLWMFKGLQRLYTNDFRFTISQRTADNLQKSIEDSCNIIGFMQDEQLIKFGSEFECSTADLYSGYCYWCSLNSVTAMKKESFNLWVKQNHHRYNITYSDYVISHSNGKKARGYRGIDTTYRSIVK